MVEETNQPESSPPQDVATAIPSGAVEDQQAEPHAPENPSADGQIQTESAPPKKPTVPVDVLFNRAVDSNDIAGARAAIARGASVRAYNTFNQTALHNAAAHGHVEMVHFLLRNGADIEALGARRETALHHAALQGHLGVVEILLRAEANVKALDSYKRTPAHAACGGSLKNQISEVMRLLFEKLGSTDDINKHVDALRPGSKTSCLHMLSENGRNDDIIWLLGLGADCNWRDSNGRTAWETASYEDWKSVAAFVLKESSLAVTLNGVEPMTWWKHEFDIKEEKFVEYSFDVNCRSALYALLLDLTKERPHLKQKSFMQIGEVLERPIRDDEIPGPLEPTCIYDMSAEATDRDRERKFGEDYRGIVPNKLSIVMPFLHTRFMKDIELERGVGDAGRAAVQSFLAQWQYCRSNSLKPFDIHQPLPLDEYCRSVIFERKPELRRERMRDQVLAHYRSSLASKLDYAPIVVSQAWIWKIEDILITGPQQYIFGNGSDRDNSILARDNIEDTSGRTIGLAWSLPSTIGLKLSYLISTFNDRVDTAEGRPREKTLDGYEKAIALIFEQANAYSKLRGVEAIDVDTEGDILHRINDVRDELSMIKRVLNQQEEVWREFASSAWPSYWPDGRDGRMKVPIDELYNSERSQIWRQILRPQTQFREFERRIAQLDEDAERIEKSINSKLDLKTKKATLDETHATSLMSAAVFGFTIITIIFTPLSFVVALFALPIDMFQREQIQSRWTDEAGMFTKQYIGTWVATAEVASVAFAFFCMWAAAKLSLGFSIRKYIERKKERRRKKAGKVAAKAELASAEAKQSSLTTDTSHAGPKSAAPEPTTASYDSSILAPKTATAEDKAINRQTEMKRRHSTIGPKSTMPQQTTPMSRLWRRIVHDDVEKGRKGKT